MQCFTVRVVSGNNAQSGTAMQAISSGSILVRMNLACTKLLIDKRRKMCYNNKREARNRLALVCVLPGQTGFYRFKSLKGSAGFFTLKR